MGKRLKQIKKSDIHGYEKKVVDSLLGGNKPIVLQKEESHESMRCKVEILEGYDKRSLVDSFIVNTNSLSETMSDILLKYGKNAQFVITNLYDEKIVAKRLCYVGCGNKEKEDKERFNHWMDVVRRIHKMRDEGVIMEDIYSKISSLTTGNYIRYIYNSTEEECKQNLRDRYGNQSLGKSSQSEILSKDLNIKEDNIDINLVEQTKKVKHNEC